jgi:hypothetical protein
MSINSDKNPVKTILDTFFVPFHCSKNTRIDVFVKNSSRYKFSEKAVRIFIKFTRTDEIALMSFYIAFL